MVIFHMSKLGSPTFVLVVVSDGAGPDMSGTFAAMVVSR
jgi:hypothetical protein